VLFAQQNTMKTAKRNSKTDFYFVTCFYSLYDICMADGKDIKDSRYSPKVIDITPDYSSPT